MGVWETIKADPLVGARMLIAEYGDRLYGVALILEQESHIAEDLVSRTVRQAVVKIELNGEDEEVRLPPQLLKGLNLHRQE